MRLAGWEAALAAAVEDARARPFEWGVHDCATWAFDVRRALTGQDAAAAWRGRYSTAKGALRTLRLVLGAATHAEAATAILGAPLASPRQAQRGDIVLVEMGDGDSFGVCLGAKAAFLGPQGLEFLPVAGCTHAWRVERCSSLRP